MAAFIPAAIAGAGQALGTWQTNATNERIANTQMKFQERMSSTAYQRAMMDMEQAGLNPMLAYQQGGASSPAGAGYHAQNVLGNAVSSAQEAAMASGQLRNLNEQNKNLQEMNKQIQADARYKDALTAVAKQEEIAKGHSAKLLATQLPSATWKAALDDSAIGRFLQTWDYGTSKILPSFKTSFGNSPKMSPSPRSNPTFNRNPPKDPPIFNNLFKD